MAWYEDSAQNYNINKEYQVFNNVPCACGLKGKIIQQIFFIHYFKKISYIN